MNTIQEDILHVWFGNYVDLLSIKLEDAEVCSVGGVNNEDAVNWLIKEPYIASQIKELNPDDIRKELDEYGCWEDYELASNEDNIVRLVWIACGNISEEPETYKID